MEGIGMQALGWLAALVVLLVLEAVSLGLTTIWFAGGALVAFLLALMQASTLLQFTAFCAVSLLLLVFTRPAAARWMNRGRIRTNAESLIGETAVVSEAIDNLAAAGHVQVRGQFLTARSIEDGGKIESGKCVTIKQINGVKLMVKEEVYE